MVDINIDMAKLKALPRRLKVVIGVVVVDALFLVAAYVVLDNMMAERVARIDQRKTALVQLRKQDAELHKQADEYPALRQRYEAAIAAGLTAPLDRLTLIQGVQDSAGHHHLSDLHYKLTADASRPEATNPHFRTETDRVVFDNGGLLDTDVLAFWKDVLARANGHYQIAEISLERFGDVDAAVLGNIRRGNPVSLVKAHFDLQWTGLQPTTQGAQ